MNVPMIAMTTWIPVVMSLTISIAVFVKTKTHSNHSLKLEFMIAASWSLTVFVFVIPCMTTTGAAGDHRLLYRFRTCTKKQKIILFSSLGFTSIIPPYKCSHTLLEFTYNFGGLMQARRSSMANTLKSSLFCINPLSCYLLSCQHEVVLRIQPTLQCMLFLFGWPPCQRSDLILMEVS